MGGDEYFENGICLIEWGEIIKEALPENYIELNIEKDEKNENYRHFNIATHGTKFLDIKFN